MKPLRGGFTLTEILAATAILSVMFTIMFGILQQTSRGWQAANRKVEVTQAARLALEQISSDLENCLVVMQTNVWVPSQTQGTTNYAFGFAFLRQSQPAISTNWLPSGGTVVPSVPNDAIFVVTPRAGSASTPGTDLTEIGYVPMFVGRPQGYANTPEGRYVLVRSYSVNIQNRMPTNDFFNNPGAWELTPGVKSENQSGIPINNFFPILDNCLRFSIRFLYRTTPNGPLLGPTNVWGRPTTNGTWEGSPGNVQGLPVAADISLSVVDERAAQRIYRLKQTTILSSSILESLPDLEKMRTALRNEPALLRTLEESLETFQRRVYFKNGGP